MMLQSMIIVVIMTGAAAKPNQLTPVYLQEVPDLHHPYHFGATIKSKFATIRDRYYSFSHNPNNGYQPYWADGEYVINDPYWAIESRGLTTKKIPQVCGEDCNPSYRGIQEVCTHWSENNLMLRGCWPRILFGYCGGDPIADFQYPFREFPTYCNYLALVCQAKYWEARYHFLHLGPCKTKADDWFGPLNDQEQIYKRLKKYSLFVQVSTPAAGQSVNKDSSTTKGFNYQNGK